MSDIRLRKDALNTEMLHKDPRIILERAQRSEELVQKFARQIDGAQLPNLKELEGAEFTVRVANGRLNWTQNLPIIVIVDCW